MNQQLTPEQIKVALARCETEAIHRIGLIQPHGAMLVLAADEAQTILQVSSNLSRFFPLAPEQVLMKGLAERMLLKLGKPLNIAGQPLQAAASIGIALFPDEQQCAASLIQQADSAMYQAKKMGGCRAVSGLMQASD